MKFRHAFLLGSLIILFDYLIKAWIHENIPLINSFPYYPYGGIAVFRNVLGGIQFSIVHTTNTGAAWGVLENWPNLLVAIRILFVIVLSAWFFISKGNKMLIPITLIIAGAIGNLIDFFIYGEVIDYLYFGFWGWPFAIFNLADSSIFIGVVWLFFGSYGKKQSPACEKTRG